MNQDWNSTLLSLLEAIRSAARRDPELREAIQSFAGFLLSDERPRAEAGDVDAAPATPTVAREAEPATAPPPTAQTTLRLGNAQATIRAVGTEEEARAAASVAPRPPGPIVVVDAPPRDSGGFGFPGLPAPVDLQPVARRCRIKSAACRYAIERRQRISSSDENEVASVIARGRELFSQAKSISDCYLWMMDPHGPSLPDDATLETLVGCYEAAASACDLFLVLTAPGDGEDLYEAMMLLAEAQSALRAGLIRVDRGLEDFDQRQMFFWLKRETSQRQIYVPRHMRVDDPADPEQWLRRTERVATLRREFDDRRGADERRRSLLNKARYHAKKLRDLSAAANPAADSIPEDWPTLAGAVDQLVTSGLKPSDREIRELMLPLLEVLPELDWPPGLRAVLDEIDRYLDRVDSEQEQSSQSSSPRRQPSEVLQQARELLRGRVVVLVGGQPREQHRRKIEKELELAELRWVAVLHHQSLYAELLHQCQRPETSLFITMTRFRSHQFGPQMRQWCRQYGKAFVELPGGYGVEQVAHQVMAQASAELAKMQPMATAT
jgi:hypothetical protein